IANIEKEHRWLKGKQIIGVADPSIWDASRGEAIIESAERLGVYFNKGDNTRLPGWMQVHYRLQFDDNGIPDMYIFCNCKGFIRTMPLLQYSRTRPEDLDTDGEDHIADETRYMCMARPIKPKKVFPKKEMGDDPLELSGQKYRKYSYWK
ncbi:MAG: Terminase-like family protein, partial [Clostridiales bacterium]|nr:Terminase-like family protein [Clostridiales bacterium]